MTDRELIELAARGGRYTVHGWIGQTFYVVDKESVDEHFDPFPWNPSECKDQAFDLAQRIGMNIYFSHSLVCFGGIAIFWPKDEPTAERAITRAAAEIGRGMV